MRDDGANADFIDFDPDTAHGDPGQEIPADEIKGGSDRVGVAHVATCVSDEACFFYFHADDAFDTIGGFLIREQKLTPLSLQWVRTLA